MPAGLRQEGQRIGRAEEFRGQAMHSDGLAGILWEPSGRSVPPFSNHCEQVSAAEIVVLGRICGCGSRRRAVVLCSPARSSSSCTFLCGDARRANS